jgi:hypothetical protein
MAMTIYHDTREDLTTIALLGGIGPGETVYRVEAMRDEICLLFNARGQLIGIDLKNMDLLHPDLARDVVQMRPVREGDLE